MASAAFRTRLSKAISSCPASSSTIFGSGASLSAKRIPSPAICWRMLSKLAMSWFRSTARLSWNCRRANDSIWRATHVSHAGCRSGRVARVVKGLQHGFGVSGRIPLDHAERWLGRAELFTAASYSEAVSAEQEDPALSIASRPRAIYRVLMASASRCAFLVCSAFKGRACGETHYRVDAALGPVR